MAVTNTGVVLRTITGVHDANFVRPLGDEEVLNGGFDDASNWTTQAAWSISDGVAVSNSSNSGLLYQDNVYLNTTSEYKTTFKAKSINGSSVTLRVYDGLGSSFKVVTITSSDFEDFTLTRQRQGTNSTLYFYNISNAEIEIDNISVKEVLVNRESTATNTGIVERSLTGVNESEAMFPDNTTSTVVSISPLYGEVMADVGDSLLDQNGTQPILMTKYNIVSNQSLSVSGKKMVSGDANSIVNQIQGITNNPKLILIGGGTNDFGLSSAIGELSSTDTTEYCGAVSFVLDYAIANYPDAKILKLGLPFGDWQTAGSFANGQTNSLGLTRYDYMNAEKQLCEDRNIVYVNQLEELGWNALNILDKTSDRVHPNAEGSQDRASLFSAYINTLYPAIDERLITGLNESDLWLDSESTSVVNNTGIVERPITGVNESDPMFPDNTISNIVNIAGLISSLLADLEARATTFENREATQNILINLQKC